LKELTVRGSVTYADISAGYSTHSFQHWKYSSFNPDARLGVIRVVGDLTASTITAGIEPGSDYRFGTADDRTEAGEPTEIKSRIASIIVGGQVTGTGTGGDAFGIAAQQILSMTIGGVPVLLTSGTDTIQLAPETNDVLLREHAS
jgi:hypothetical protein